MKNFVAIDPSINESGVAVVKNGKIVKVSRVTVSKSGSVGARVARMSAAINKAIPPSLLRVIELPMIYKEDTPNKWENIIKLVLVCGGIATSKTEYVRPGEWKKRTRKDVKTRRIEKQLRTEFPELAKQLDAIPQSVRHNALDAAGIALWKLGIIWEKGK